MEIENKKLLEDKKILSAKLKKALTWVLAYNTAYNEARAMSISKHHEVHEKVLEIERILCHIRPVRPPILRVIHTKILELDEMLCQLRGIVTIN